MSNWFQICIVIFALIDCISRHSPGVLVDNKLICTRIEKPRNWYVSIIFQLMLAVVFISQCLFILVCIPLVNVISPLHNIICYYHEKHLTELRRKYAERCEKSKTT